MASPTLTDQELVEQFGYRLEGQPVLEPFELGWKCPKEHEQMSFIQWSEFKEHLWCVACNIDYHSQDCYLVQPGYLGTQEFTDFLDSLPFSPARVITAEEQD